MPATHPRLVASVAPLLAALLAAAVPALALAAPAPGAPAAAAPAPGSAVVLLQEPVLVVATLSGDTSGIYAGTVAVSRGEQRFEVPTVVRPAGTGGYADALAQVRRAVGWQGPYLFVATACGKGTALRCATESVFLLRDGKLSALGTLAAREGGGFGTCYRGGAFLELDTDFEFNDVQPRGGGPRIEVLMHERGGELVGDADSTWALNAAQYAANAQLARQHTQPEIVGYRRTWDFVFGPRFENALLARYCGRAAALDSTVAEARRTLPAKLMEHFDAMLARVQPGKLPGRSRFGLPPGR